LENNEFLCRLLSNLVDDELMNRAMKKLGNPFISYSIDILMKASEQMNPLMLFENYDLASPAENRTPCPSASPARFRKLRIRSSQSGDLMKTRFA